MSKEKKKGGKKTSNEEAVAPGDNAFDRFLEDVRENPMKWVKVIVAIAVIGFGVKFAWGYFTEKGRTEDKVVWDKVVAAVTQGGTTPAERLGGLKDIESEVPEDNRMYAYYWWLRATAARDAAVEAEDVSEMLDFYRDCAAACGKIPSGTPWRDLPWKSAAVPTQPQPSLVARLGTHAREQIKWLETHMDSVPPAFKPDEGVLATLVLKDANAEAPKSYTLKVRLYSSAAPYAVDTFARMVREGYWKDKHVFGVQEDDENTATVDAVLFGSPFSKDPTRWDVHGNEEDWVGWTLPMEKSGLEAKRGRVAFELRREKNTIAGGSPSQLVFITSDDIVRGTDRIVFGEIEDSDEALDWLENLGFDKEKKLSTPLAVGDVFAPNLSIAVETFELTGAPQNAPPTPLPYEHQEPEMPEKPEPEKKDDEGEGAPGEGGDAKDKDEGTPGKKGGSKDKDGAAPGNADPKKEPAKKKDGKGGS